MTAESMVRSTCEEIGPFAITYNGFADSEDESFLDTQPTASCEANDESPAGDYPITVSGGASENYDFIYINGTLTLAADDIAPILSVKDITLQLDQDGQASITAHDVIENVEDNCGIADTTLSQYTFAVDDIGEVNVIVTAFDTEGNSTAELVVVTVQSYVGINNLIEWNSRVYPNPTEGMVEMVLPEQVDQVKVLDMTGKIVLFRSNLRSIESFDLSSFSNGVYIFQLQMGETLQHVKVIKK